MGTGPISQGTRISRCGGESENALDTLADRPGVTRSVGSLQIRAAAIKEVFAIGEDDGVLALGNCNGHGVRIGGRIGCNLSIRDRHIDTGCLSVIQRIA